MFRQMVSQPATADDPEFLHIFYLPKITILLWFFSAENCKKQAKYNHQNFNFFIDKIFF
jgi:hypothetical protein